MLNNSKVVYIFNLPYNERRKLCHILDSNLSWETLAAEHMSYDIITIQTLRREFSRNNSPTEELLTLWGSHNHTVLELFVLLHKMQHYQAMEVIKNLVDEEYHYLIKSGEDHQRMLRKQLGLEEKPCSKRLDVPRDNLNNEIKPLNVGSKIDSVVSNEDNASVAPSHQGLHPKAAAGRFATTNGVIASSISCVAESARSIPHISFEELQRSTNNWDPSKILGKGGFGTVYKGVWKCTQVAIKKIEQRGEDNPESHNEQIRQSFTELHCLNSYRHDNVLPVYGYSLDGLQPCLIYQYMSGGSLEYRLRTRDPSKFLKWSKRLNIAIGIARGLQFLHTVIGDKPLIHGDIKPANILLDPCDNAKIGDFGLAREGAQSNDKTYVMVSRIQGTRPYLPDEYLRSKKASTKVDTYSFGVVLFELATGLRAYAAERPNKFLRDHVVNYEEDINDLKDKRIENSDSCYIGLIDIGKLCVTSVSKNRPEMVTVLILLEDIVL